MLLHMQNHLNILILWVTYIISCFFQNSLLRLFLWIVGNFVQIMLQYDLGKGAFTNDVSTQGGRGDLTNDDVSKKGHFAAIPTNTKTRIPNF